ncbi:MAG: hypothetical protein ACPGO7_04040 [Alphaproteobacteria bacterium]
MNLLDVIKQITEYIDSSPEFVFAKNTLIRVFVFIVIALSAVGLNSIVVYLEDRGAPTWVIVALSLSEFILVAADVLWFIKPLVLEIVETTKEIFRGAPVLLSITISLALLVWAVSSPAVIELFNNTVSAMVEFAGETK